VARKPRDEAAGAVQHAYARGNRQQRIYLDDEDRSMYLALLGGVTKRYRWRCLAFCLMDNHVHLLVETPAAGLGSGIQRLHGLYGQWFNRRHRRSGHLFQGRFGSVPMTSDAQLVQTARYIARNPVEARLCDHAADWPWSSHAAVVTRAAPIWLDTSRLLDYFAADGGEPLQRYAAFVDA
jgi:putative transposase